MQRSYNGIETDSTDWFSKKIAVNWVFCSYYYVHEGISNFTTVIHIYQSTLDLVFTQEPDLVSEVQDLGPFDSSDHHLLMWVINRSYDADRACK